MPTLEEQYKTANFDYIETTEEDTVTDFVESLETTEEFLVNLDVNFYEL